MRPTLSTKLRYTAPYDWESIVAVFRAHRVPHLDSVDDLGYERVVHTSQGMGWFRISADKRHHFLRLCVWNASEVDIAPISSAVRGMFDLDANPDVIRGAMSADPYLATVWEHHPGLRVARAWSPFETLLTTVLGQLVSVSFGRVLVGELMKAAGVKVPHPKTERPIHLFPTPTRLLRADLSSVRTSEARRTTIRSLANLVVNGAFKSSERIPFNELRKTLLSVPGIGAWTSEYIAMRGFHDNDAFPATDYELKQEMKRHPGLDINRVRPWRAYAATALWKTFVESKRRSYESAI